MSSRTMDFQESPIATMLASACCVPANLTERQKNGPAQTPVTGHAKSDWVPSIGSKSLARQRPCGVREPGAFPGLRRSGTGAGRKSVGPASAAIFCTLALAGSAMGQETSLVSVDSSGGQSNWFSQAPAMSADGRYVAFQTLASDLVSGDTNGVLDVIVHDRQSGVAQRVSVSSGGAQGNAQSILPSISGNGRFVAFISSASNLVAGDANGFDDIFVHDRQNGTTERVSVDSNGAQGNSFSFNPSISADGRFVAFDSNASNLVAGDTNNATDVFVHDRQSGITQRVSLDSGGAQGDSVSARPSISADGRYVAFDSTATNLFGGDTNGREDVFVHDRQSGSTQCASVSSSGVQGDSYSMTPSISADGRYVAFHSVANNLVSGDTNVVGWDAFVHDRQTGVTERVNVTSNGAQANGSSLNTSISADGRFVAFESNSSNLVSVRTYQGTDIFIHDRQTGTTEVVSVNSGGGAANGASLASSISADGRYIAFESDASNLVGADTNFVRDIFVRDQSSGVGWKYCTANANSTGAPANLGATGSASSSASNLVLSSSSVPNQNGLFFHGSNQAQLPFGNGVLCTTGGLVRGAVVIGVGNVATYTYDNTDPLHSVAAFVGITRYFQYWFRDPLGGGAMFNTSDAMSIVILP